MGHINEEATSLKTQLLVYLVEFRIFQDSPLELFVEECIVIIIDVESTILMLDGSIVWARDPRLNKCITVLFSSMNSSQAAYSG